MDVPSIQCTRNGQHTPKVSVVMVVVLGDLQGSSGQVNIQVGGWWWVGEGTW